MVLALDVDDSLSEESFAVGEELGASFVLVANVRWSGSGSGM